MWLTFAVLMGTLINPATTASLPALTGANSGTQAAAETDKEALNKKLYEAVLAEDTEKTLALLKSGADANGSDGFGRHCLTRAMLNNDMRIARILVEAGANVNQPDTDSPGGPSYPLALAVALDKVEMARLLLSHGANVNVAAPGQGPPLESTWDHVEMARLLLSFGANVNGRGPGHSPLWMALSGNYLEMAKVLIAAGADVKAEKAFAESHHQADIVKRLEKLQGPAPPPMTAEQVVSFLRAPSEPMEWAESRSDSEGPTDADVTRVVRELRSRLKAKPDDQQALLLWAHFALVREPFKLPAEAQPPTSEPESLPPPAVALDRVLATQPHNAEALFLKGRLTLDSDSGKALVLLRQALEFAPGNPRYGVFLAQILVEQGRPGEAAQILRSVQKNHPALPFLDDLDSLGLPEGGELVFDGRMEHTTSSPESGEACSMCAFTMADDLSNTHLEDPWRLRMRIYYFKKSPAEIEAFYSNRIAGFRFIEEKEKQPGSQKKRDRSYDQFVQINSGGMKPVSNSSELRDFARAKDGISLLLLDTNDHPHLKRKLAPGEHICYLFLTNLRK